MYGDIITRLNGDHFKMYREKSLCCVMGADSVVGSTMEVVERVNPKCCHYTNFHILYLYEMMDGHETYCEIVS